MLQILAQTGVTTPPDPLGPYLPYIIIGVVVMGLSTIGQLFLVGKQLVGGNKGDRKIEPTELHAINTKLDEQTVTLNKLDREMGETKGAVDGLKNVIAAHQESVKEKIAAQQEQVTGAFTRINAISTESAATKIRMEDHLRDHREGRFDA